MLLADQAAHDFASAVNITSYLFDHDDVLQGYLDYLVVRARVLARCHRVEGDVAELNGAWGAVGEVSLDRGRCLIIDPTYTLPTDALQMLREPASGDIDIRSEAGYVIGCAQRPAGRFLVEEFTSEDHGIEGIRLRRVDGQVRPRLPH